MVDQQVSPQRRPWPRRVLNRLEVDRAVFYAIASRAWQFLAGPITLVLIANFFTGEVQGFYYTFWSVLALQSFFDFSLNQVLISFASHEWERLSLTEDGSIAGDAAALARLSNVWRASLVWYGVAAIVFSGLVGVVGVVFFQHSAPATQLAWAGPWWALVITTAALFLTTPCLAVLEGCNQVRNIYKLQFVKAVAANVVVWTAIPLGASLWIPALAATVRLLGECLWIAQGYRRFFASCLAAPRFPKVPWRSEVWPLQWRVGFKGIVAYFNNYLIGPIVFYFHGPVAAGQLGMTWQILTSVEAACASWVKTRAARFGMLISKRDYRELDRIFFRLTTIATVVSVGLSVTFCLLVVVLNVVGSRFANRLLSPVPTVLLAIAMQFVLIPDCLWTYIHAHKRSPQQLPTLVGAILSASLIGGLGVRYGAVGIAVAYLLVNALYYLPLWLWVWSTSRREWHADKSADEPADRPRTSPPLS